MLVCLARIVHVSPGTFWSFVVLYIVMEIGTVECDGCAVVGVTIVPCWLVGPLIVVIDTPFLPFLLLPKPYGEFSLFRDSFNLLKT